MSDTPRLTSAKRLERAAQQERLAKALRDNLRRRKEQDRDRRAPQPMPPLPARGDKSAT